MTKKTRSSMVAVVDDDEAVRTALAFLLGVVGHEAQTFSSVEQLMAFGTTSFGCLILDHNMPKISGLEFAATLRADGNSIPIALITADLSPAISQRAALLGIDRVFEKPPPEDAILSFVERAAGR